MTPLPVGARAPGFALRHTFEHTVHLSELIGQGPAVLCFYVFDFGSV